MNSTSLFVLSFIFIGGGGWLLLLALLLRAEAREQAKNLVYQRRSKLWIWNQSPRDFR